MSVHSCSCPADVARVKHLDVGQHTPSVDPENPDMLITKMVQIYHQNSPDLGFEHSRITGKGKSCGHSQGTQHHLGTAVPELCAGCNRSQGMVLAMALGPAMVKAALVVLEESALGLAHHHCTMAQGHWRRRFQCKFRSSQQTGGTNRCCRHRNHRNLPRICSNLRRQAAPAQVVRVAQDHHWR